MQTGKGAMGYAHRSFFTVMGPHPYAAAALPGQVLSPVA